VRREKEVQEIEVEIRKKFEEEIEEKEKEMKKKKEEIAKRVKRMIEFYCCSNHLLEWHL